MCSGLCWDYHQARQVLAMYGALRAEADDTMMHHVP
jgi:hypothetical protein